MHFKRIQDLVLEREQVCSKIRAIRVQEVRKFVALALPSGKIARDDDVVKHLMEIEALISKVFYVKSDIDDLLDLIEAAIEEQS